MTGEVPEKSVRFAELRAEVKNEVRRILKHSRYHESSRLLLPVTGRYVPFAEVQISAQRTLDAAYADGNTCVVFPSQNLLRLSHQRRLSGPSN